MTVSATTGFCAMNAKIAASASRSAVEGAFFTGYVKNLWSERTVILDYWCKRCLFGDSTSSSMLQQYIVDLPESGNGLLDTLEPISIQ